MFTFCEIWERVAKLQLEGKLEFKICFLKFYEREVNRTEIFQFVRFDPNPVTAILMHIYDFES